MLLEMKLIAFPALHCSKKKQTMQRPRPPEEDPDSPRTLEEEEEELAFALIHSKGFHEIDSQDVHLLQRISDGSNSAFGDVWEASCHMKRVAVKIPKANSSEDTIQEWLKEIEIMQ